MPSSSSSVVILSDTESEDDGAALSSHTVEAFASSLTTQAKVDALCEKHGVPTEFAARPAGNRRACTLPPPGAICVHARALEVGLRFPLHPFFSEALSQLGLAPSQLTPNGWRVLVAFVVLCHDAGVQPSFAVFRSFFYLYSRKGWYFFRCTRGAGARPLLTGLSSKSEKKEWKTGFFFLTSPEPWPCPVRWGEPSKISTAGPAQSSQDKESVKKLKETHPAAVDLRAYLSQANLAAAFSSNLAGASPPPPQLSARSCLAKVWTMRQGPDTDPLTFPTLTFPDFGSLTCGAHRARDPHVSDPKSGEVRVGKVRGSRSAPGTDPSEEKGAETEEVKTELDRHTLPLVGKKRKHGETANADKELWRSDPRTPLAAPPPADLRGPPLSGCSASTAGLCAPPGFAPRSPQSSAPDRHDGDNADWETARKALQRIVTPSRKREFAVAKPSDVVTSTFVALYQATSHVSFSLDYTLELEKKKKATEHENAALREQLEEVKRAMEAEREKAKGELAVAKRAAAAEVETAKTSAVQQFLWSEEYTRRVAEQALAAYERGADDMKRAAVRLNPRLDVAKLVLPLD